MFMLGRRLESSGRCDRSSVSYESLDEALADVEDQFGVPKDAWRRTGDGGAISEVTDGYTYVLIPPQ